MNILSKNQIKNAILQGIGNTYYAQGIQNPPITPGSHIYSTADAFAATLQVVQSNIEADLQNTSEYSAVGDSLDKLAESYGLSRKQASQSIGFVRIQAINTSQTIYIDVTYQLTDQNGKVYTPIVSGYYSDQTLVQVISQSTGIDQNLPAGTILTWRKTPINSKPITTSYGAISGGSDIQSDIDLQIEIQNSKRAVNAGSSADLFQLVSNISPYVDAAFIYPCAQGAGSVHICCAAPSNLSTSRTRQVEQSQLNIINQKILNKITQSANVVLQSVIDNPIDLVFKLDSSGWVDAYPMPALGTSTVVQASSSSITNGIQTIVFQSDYNLATFFASNYVSGTAINLSSDQVISISTIVSPLVPSSTPFSIQNSQIVSFSQTGTSSPYTITATLNQTLSILTSNTYFDSASYIFPSHKNMPEILNSVLTSFSKIGAGEKLVTPSYRTQRYPQNPILDNRITDVFDMSLEQIPSVNTSINSYLFDSIKSGGDETNRYVSPMETAPLLGILFGSYIYTPRNIGFYTVKGL